MIFRLALRSLLTHPIRALVLALLAAAMQVGLAEAADGGAGVMRIEQVSVTGVRTLSPRTIVQARVSLGPTVK